MSYEVRIEQFNGPLSKLLELIEAKELDIALVSMAAVTGDFIRHVESLRAGQDNHGITPNGSDPFNAGGQTLVLSDFVVVASRLLLIKSKVLLPNLEFSEEEEADIADLERRLKIYRELCSMSPTKLEAGPSAAFYINKLYNEKQISYGKKFLSSLKDKAVFYPSKNITVGNLEREMARVLNALEKVLPPKEAVADNIITLQEKIEELVARLSSSGAMSLDGSFRPEDKEEVVVLFLAVLHMLANHLASVSQEVEFGKIKVVANGL